MTDTPPDRNGIAETLLERIVTLQDELTHLWAAVLAVDHAPTTDEKRDQVLASLSDIYQRWQEKQDALDNTFRAWSDIVGQQHREVIDTRAWLQASLPATSQTVSPIHLITDHDIATACMDAFNREACDHARRIAGLLPLPEDSPCNCLIDCPVINLCPLFHADNA